ncbi:MAG: putative sulfate transporter [Chlamydiae bacterium]|nr:putative sulfate transporter [Chlamydiota bacterium]
MGFRYQNIGDDISFASIRQDIQGYTWEKLRSDFFAGLGVAFVTVPQAMAFALVAGLPLSCGLFAAIYSAIIASLFGSCRHLIVGPNNTIAILVQFGTASILYSNFRDVMGPERELIALQILTQLTFLIALFQAAAAFLKLGKLTQFVSHSVVVGYLGGTALALVVNQLFIFLGISPLQGPSSLFSKIAYLVSSLGQIHWPTALIGLGSLCMLVALSRYKKFPGAVIVLVLAGVVVHFFGMSTYSDWGLFGDTGALNSNVILLGDTGTLHDIFPKIGFPTFDFSIMNELISIAFAIALLTSVETTLVAKSITASSGQPLSVNQEILGLSLANLFSSFIGALPSSGSIARSHLLYRNGGQTHFAGVFSAFSVGFIMFVFGYFVQRIPLTALSAILLIASARIVNFQHMLLCIKSTRADALVLVTTILATLFFGLDVAFYVGVVLSVTFYLSKAAVPYFVECSYDETGQIDSTHRATSQGKGKIRVINVQGELFFGAADLFQKTLKSITKNDELRVIILRLKNARDIDATACLAIQHLNQYLRESGRHLLLCGITYSTWEVLSSSGTVKAVGKENLFVVDENRPRLSLQKALIRAKRLVAVTEEVQERVPESIQPIELLEIPLSD